MGQILSLGEQFGAMCISLLKQIPVRVYQIIGLGVWFSLQKWFSQIAIGYFVLKKSSKPV